MEAVSNRSATSYVPTPLQLINSVTHRVVLLIQEHPWIVLSGLAFSVAARASRPLLDKLKHQMDPLRPYPLVFEIGLLATSTPLLPLKIFAFCIALTELPPIVCVLIPIALTIHADFNDDEE